MLWKITVMKFAIMKFAYKARIKCTAIKSVRCEWVMAGAMHLEFIGIKCKSTLLRFFFGIYTYIPWQKCIIYPLDGLLMIEICKNTYHAAHDKSSIANHTAIFYSKQRHHFRSTVKQNCILWEVVAVQFYYIRSSKIAKIWIL